MREAFEMSDKKNKWVLKSFDLNNMVGNVRKVWFHYTPARIHSLKVHPVKIGLRWLPKLGVDTSPRPQTHRRAWYPKYYKYYDVCSVRVSCKLSTILELHSWASKDLKNIRVYELVVHNVWCTLFHSTFTYGSIRSMGSTTIRR